MSDTPQDSGRDDAAEPQSTESAQAAEPQQTRIPESLNFRLPRVSLLAVLAIAARAISSSVCAEPRESSSITLRYKVRVAKSMLAKSLSERSTASTMLASSKKSGQFTSEISRMLVMMLRTVTFDAPWR